VIIGDHLTINKPELQPRTKQRRAPATTSSPGSATSFPAIVNISGYISGFAPLKHRTLRQADGHAARQFIEYEKQMSTLK